MKYKLYLLSGLVSVLLMIGLVETGVFNLYSDHLLAQDQAKVLKLSRGEETVSIPLGDWVVVQMGLQKKTYTGGKFKGISGENLMLEAPTRKTIKNRKPAPVKLQVPIENIDILYHGEARRVWDYTKKGARMGGLSALVIGGIMGVSCALGDNYFSSGNRIQKLGFGFLFGSIFSGFYTLPAGSILGMLTGLVKNGQAKAFPLTGDNAWRIISE